MLSGLFIAGFQSLGAKRPGPGLFVLAAFTAAAPDLDLLLGFAGFDLILGHRTFSHSLVVALAIPVLLRVMKTPAAFGAHRLSVPYVMITACLFSHAIMDLFCEDIRGPKGLMLFWPLSKEYFHAGLDVFYTAIAPSGNALPLKDLFKVAFREFYVIALPGTAALLAGRYLISRYAKPEKESA
jgi:membrane-bound metal-dependent hydrolase YbcI (DUF457 family)